MMGPEEFAPSYEAGEGVVGGNEKAQEQSERFSEQFRQAQGRLAGMKKDEKKTKRRDRNLAALLSQFLKENRDAQIINTVVSLLKQEVHAEFLLGVLSLYYPNIRSSLYAEEQEALMDNPRIIMETRQLTVTIQPTYAVTQMQDFDEHNLPEEIKQAINVWVQDMLFTAFLHPSWLLPKVYGGAVVNSTLVQLATFILERYLHVHKISGDFARQRQFVQYILSGILRETSKKIASLPSVS